VLEFQRERNRLFFATLSLPSTAMGLALVAQLSALSWILTTQYGLDVHDIGFVWAAGPLAGIFGQVIIGFISDNVWFWNGRRRQFILIGGVVAALSLLALPKIGVISSALGIESVVGIALIVALSLDFAVNVGFNPTRAIIADVTPEGDERTRGFTWMQTISGSVGVGGYAVAAIFDNYVLIYVSALVVLLFSVLPPLFIEEPEELVVEEQAQPGEKRTLWELALSIQPLWGFLIYDAYAMTLRLAGIQSDHFYAEIICGALTLVLVARTLLAKPDGAGGATDHHLQFQKVLAAHSFSWIGIHTTFVYMIIFVQHQFPLLSDIDAGRTVSLSYMILNAAGALLPLFVLQPLSMRIGRVATHTWALAVMAAAYAALYLAGESQLTVYVLIALVGVGWASIVSLPFAIMSQKVESDQMGLYMGLFNLSVVLPQLTVSLGVALAVSRAADKDAIFLISAIAVAISALAWTRVSEHEEEHPPAPQSLGGAD
jgi:Na+/melibiose symporter-like transporter